MLMSSPILLIYAIFLLISQYVYCLNLKEDELPTKIHGFNLRQIGFFRPENFVGMPILIKVSFLFLIHNIQSF